MTLVFGKKTFSNQDICYLVEFLTSDASSRSFGMVIETEVVSQFYPSKSIGIDGIFCKIEAAVNIARRIVV